MNKLLTSVGLAIGIASASLLAGCNLYFGNSHNHGDDSPGVSTPGNPGGGVGSGVPGGPGRACRA